MKITSSFKKILVITALIFLVVASVKTLFAAGAGNASTNVVNGTPTTSGSAVMPSPVSCLTALTVPFRPGSGCETTPTGQYCNAPQTTTTLSMFNSAAKGGVLCPGTYQAYFSGCILYTGQGCGGSSCGNWTSLTLWNNGSGSKVSAAGSDYWIGNTNLSSAHYNPNQGVEALFMLQPFNFSTANQNSFYFDTVTALEGNGFLEYCMMAVIQTSTTQ
jgi:hypothetical protein